MRDAWILLRVFFLVWVIMPIQDGIEWIRRYHHNLPIQVRAKCIYYLLKFRVKLRLGFYD